MHPSPTSGLSQHKIECLVFRFLKPLSASPSLTLTSLDDNKYSADLIALLSQVFAAAITAAYPAVSIDAGIVINTQVARH